MRGVVEVLDGQGHGVGRDAVAADRVGGVAGPDVAEVAGAVTVLLRADVVSAPDDLAAFAPHLERVAGVGDAVELERGDADPNTDGDRVRRRR
ncbi:MAG: hypothetical protein CVU56_24280 [Deltaproteobacteria bacterium HGW-Deltaproteobacteria-14]|nr:MAG: hypothetical protein CVU56_24280 [Deltaproteobacteria bacterium HGW-Deltaproteobacteria-14]